MAGDCIKFSTEGKASSFAVYEEASQRLLRRELIQ